MVSPDTVLLWMNKLDIPRPNRIPEPPEPIPAQEILSAALSQETVLFIQAEEEPQLPVEVYTPITKPKPQSVTPIMNVRPFRTERTPPPRPTFTPLL